MGESFEGSSLLLPDAGTILFAGTVREFVDCTVITQLIPWY